MNGTVHAGQIMHHAHFQAAAHARAAGRVLAALDRVPDAAADRAHAERAADVAQDAVWARLAPVIHA